LREDTQKALFKRPSQKLLLKTGIKPSDKNKTKKENLALCNAISPSSAYLQTNTHEQLAFDNTATIAKRHFQGTAPNIVQKRAFPQRYTRENKTLERLKHARAQEARRSVTL